jgi:hypothetical protein
VGYGPGEVRLPQRGVVEDHAVIGGAPARILRRFAPGVGWVTADGDIRPLTPARF